jgi:hypothetical protein
MKREIFVGGRLWMLVLGGAVLAGPAGVARAGEPTTPAQADEMAQTAADRAAQYRELGGVGYKTGLVQREEADATRYANMADEMRAPPASVSVESDQVQHDLALAEQYKLMGGVAYKTGLVQRAEADASRAEQQEAAAVQGVPTSPPEAKCDANKPQADVGTGCQP